ncbi:LuxR family transcriptional regulator [Bradyrhizobium sp. 2TAF24]|uniref:LuxR family transcriptional regulator n=1 Tax=Bradyrhizobium sp. 2TAF24 TaxID=3233011 RepID=UPI003F8FEA6F
MGDEFATALEVCATIDAVKALFKRRIAAHGYTASACGAFLTTDMGPETHFFFQDWPPDWIELYTRRNFLAADYMVAEARRRIAPFTWLEAKAERTLSRAEQEIWDTAAEWGWTDGFSVPIYGPGGYFGLVAMAGKEQPMPPALRRELHQIAFLTHERCRALTGLAPVADPQAVLTHRELECLRWVAAGKTDLEIARLLGVSQTTARTHIDQARRKLGARTRSQAVARLVLSGLS